MKTKEIKVSELSGSALDWCVAKAIGEYKPVAVPKYSTDWGQGGPIIEREKIKISPYHNCGLWWAEHGITSSIEQGCTPLIASMRCFVASKMGDIVSIPLELLEV